MFQERICGNRQVRSRKSRKEAQKVNELGYFGIKRLFPNASKDLIAANTQIQPAESECDQAPALGGPAEREETCVGSITLRYRFYRVRPQDPENAAASTKDLTDGIRRCGLIPGDDPWQVRLEVEQVKVKTFHHEKTVIEIIWP
jgi:hypothetical protein